MADKILIVEDERITAEDLAEVLKDQGYQISAIVSSGDDAIRQAEESPPDLVLMDIRIRGEMDGAEIARILRERFDIPVVYLTAHADRDTLERAKRSRPLGYIVKPFHEAELHANVEMALYKHWHDRRSRNREQHVTDVFGALSLGIASVDQSGTIQMMNRAAEDLTGWTMGEAAGSPVRRIFRLAEPATGRDLELPLDQALNERSVVEIRDRILITKDGGQKLVSGNIAPLRGADGGPGGGVIMFEAGASAPEAPYLATKTKRESQTIEFGRFQIVAASQSMKRLLSFALRVAKSEASTVLLEGESGTGKDLMAQFLHYSSNRSGRPFIALNCSAIPETLLESELFGREPGAYTDARSPKKGLLEVAHGGTLFLDEIGDLSPAVQAKFLRVLEHQSFRRLGGVQDINVDLRVVAATNRNLSGAVQNGTFRLDLFHRLSVIQIVPPPLRDHPEDILPLAGHFVQAHNRRYKANIQGISPSAATALETYQWPGNVRELRNVIERAILLEETDLLQLGSIQFVSHTPPDLVPTGKSAEPLRPPSAPADLSLKNSERTLIVQALQKTAGNKTRAATLLGISRDVLRYRMKKLDLLDD